MTAVLDAAPLLDPDPQVAPLWVNHYFGRRVTLLLVGGELDIASAPILIAAVEPFTTSGRYRRIVLDLSAVTFVDLHGLRALEHVAATAAGTTALDVVPSAALVRLRQALLLPSTAQGR